MKTVKTAISLPTETYRKAEKIRKKLGKSRSRMLAEALDKLVKEIERQEADEKYAAAYRAMPETPEEIADATAGLGKGWSDDDEWEEPGAAR